jgi:E3 ubiquitin-protein ligase RNF216
MPQIATPPIQNQGVHPTPDFLQGAVQMEPLAGPSRDQLPNHDPIVPASDHAPVNHELPPPANTAYAKVAQEPDERLVERVREVVPDVLPSHVLKLLAQHKKATFSGILLDVIIHNLLEDQSYPRDTKGKGKERAAEKKLVEFFGNNSMNIDYTHPNADKPVGSAYRVLCMVCINSSLLRRFLTCVKQKYLSTNFPTIDKKLILEALSLHEGHYAPTYLYLLHNGATSTSVVPVTPKPGKRKKRAKGRSSLNEEDLVKEHTWLVEGLRYRRNAPVVPQVEEEEGGDIECGCCFSSYSFVSFLKVRIYPIHFSFRTRWHSVWTPTYSVKAV